MRIKQIAAMMMRCQRDIHTAIAVLGGFFGRYSSELSTCHKLCKSRYVMPHLLSKSTQHREYMHASP